MDITYITNIPPNAATTAVAPATTIPSRNNAPTDSMASVSPARFPFGAGPAAVPDISEHVRQLHRQQSGLDQPTAASAAGVAAGSPLTRAGVAAATYRHYSEYTDGGHGRVGKAGAAYQTARLPGDRDIPPPLPRPRPPIGGVTTSSGQTGTGGTGR